MIPINRRAVMAGSALAATAAVWPGAARAAVPPAKTQGPGVYRYRLGEMQLTALYDGIWFLKIDEPLVRNATPTDVDKALTTAFLQPGVLPISFTALLVNTGRKLVLIDTGTAGQIVDSAGALLDNLAVAGVKPADIDTVLISHFHPDHINGIRTKDGDKVFANAEIMVPEPEWTFWMDDANLRAATKTTHKYFLNARRIFADIAKEVTRFTPGKDVVPGIASIAAYGHTPGHTAFALASGGQSMLVLSDTAREPWLFVRHPLWQPAYDMDGPMAAEARLRMLDRAAADRMLVEAFHFPFPGAGHIVKTAAGFELEPVLWQPL